MACCFSKKLQLQIIKWKLYAVTRFFINAISKSVLSLNFTWKDENVLLALEKNETQIEYKNPIQTITRSHHSRIYIIIDDHFCANFTLKDVFLSRYRHFLPLSRHPIQVNGFFSDDGLVFFSVILPDVIS